MLIIVACAKDEPVDTTPPPVSNELPPPSFTIPQPVVSAPELDFEYDSKYFQTGLKLKPIKPFKIMFGLWDLNKPTFSLN